MSTWTCIHPGCTATITLSDDHKRVSRQAGDSFYYPTFYCRSGHANMFGSAALAKAEQEIAELKDDLRVMGGPLRKEWRRSAALRGQITKLRKRLEAHADH